MFNFDVYFRNIEVINYFNLKKSINYVEFEKVYELRCWIWYHTRHSSNTITLSKSFKRLCRMVLDKICTNVTP